MGIVLRNYVIIVSPDACQEEIDAHVEQLERSLKSEAMLRFFQENMGDFPLD
jgi:hypothetical protein